MNSSSLPNVHTLALIKGSVEGDSFKHFASLLGVDEHAQPLVAAGLLVSNGYDYDATEAGKTFYDQQRLDQLPGGRANSWGATLSGEAALLTADQALTAKLADKYVV